MKLTHPAGKLPTFEYHATPLTLPIHRHPARFRIIDCGRRFGKSFMAMAEGFQMSYDAHLKQTHRPTGLVVAPTYEMVEKDWKIAQHLMREILRDVSESRKTLNLGYLGEIEFRSTDSQGGAGRGGGYDWMILDEAARIPAQVWEDDLRPALSDRMGRAIFISTPTGRNWFYDLWRKGQDPQQSHYKSWKYATIDGWRARFKDQPELLKAYEAEWDQIMAQTSYRTFAQEYQAEFLEQEGALWSLSKVLRGILREALPTRHYVAGVDVAHVNDWMVTAVFEAESHQLVGLHRSRYHDWSIQKAEAAALLRQYPNPHVLVDSTGMGDPIAYDLRQEGFDVEDVNFATPRLKQELVENLSVAIDHGYIAIPDQDETQWLLDELRSYQEIKSPSGHLRYSAPEGQHDDGVTAVMLAVWGLRYELQRPPKSFEEARPLHVWESPLMMRDYMRRVKRWERAYPNLQVPSHPDDLEWMANQAWQRMPVS